MFYLFHGPDTYRQREALAAELAKLGDADMLSLNTTRLASRVSFAELQGACDAMPFLAPARVVIVQDLFVTVPDKAFMDKLEAYLPALPLTTRLFFLEAQALTDSHRIIRLAAKQKIGEVRQFQPLKDNDLDRWIQARAADKGGRIAPQAAHLLAEHVGGGNLQALSNEIEKLTLYRGPGATIEAADVQLLSPDAAEASIFPLMDAIGGRQAVAAAKLFQEKLNEGAEPFLLFSMIIRQFRLLIQTRALLDGGERPAGVAAQLHVPTFVADKLVRQARGYSLSQLEHIYRRLLEIDVEAKTGRADLLTALHLLVAGLTVEQ